MPENDRAPLIAAIEAASVAITVRSMPLVLQSLLSTELTIAQLRVLSAVAISDDGASGARLAEMFGISMASVSRLVGRLVAHGLVTRSVDEDDLRVRRVRATPRGRRAVTDLMMARPELSAGIVERLSLDELAALERGLSAVSRELRELRREGDER